MESSGMEITGAGGMVIDEPGWGLDLVMLC